MNSGLLHPPCVNNSVYNTTISGSDIYLGFDCLKNLEGKLATRIPEERLIRGNYTSLENFVLCTGAGLEQLIVLIRVGALRFTGIDKKELLWEAHLLLSGNKQKQDSIPLFGEMNRKPVLPKLETSLLEDLYDEIELIGFPVRHGAYEQL